MASVLNHVLAPLRAPPYGARLAWVSARARRRRTMSGSANGGPSASHAAVASASAAAVASAPSKLNTCNIANMRGNSSAEVASAARNAAMRGSTTRSPRSISSHAAESRCSALPSWRNSLFMRPVASGSCAATPGMHASSNPRSRPRAPCTRSTLIAASIASPTRALTPAPSASSTRPPQPRRTIPGKLTPGRHSAARLPSPSHVHDQPRRTPPLCHPDRRRRR